MQLEAQLSKLRAQPASKVSSADAALDASGDSKDPVLTERIKKAEKLVKHYKGLDSELHDIDPDCAGCLARAESDLAVLRTSQRERRPLKAQKSSAEAHLNKQQALLAAAQEERTALAEQRDAVDAAIAENLAHFKRVEDEVSKAKAEVLTISEKLTADLRADDHADATAVTATAVLKFFADLPPEVAQHPQGSTAIASIRQLLDQLDLASKSASAARAAAALSAVEKVNEPPDGEHHMDEDIDEEGLQLFAELATPECEGEQQGAREARIADTKERLRLRKVEVARGLRKTKRGKQ